MRKYAHCTGYDIHDLGPTPTWLAYLGEDPRQGVQLHRDLLRLLVR